MLVMIMYSKILKKIFTINKYNYERNIIYLLIREKNFIIYIFDIIFLFFYKKKKI